MSLAEVSVDRSRKEKRLLNELKKERKIKKYRRKKNKSKKHRRSDSPSSLQKKLRKQMQREIVIINEPPEPEFVP